MLDSLLKDYVVFRINRREGGFEITGDSVLGSEAIRFAELLAETEGTPHASEDLSYEVRTSRTGESVATISVKEARSIEKGGVHPLEFPLCFASS